MTDCTAGKNVLLLPGMMCDTRLWRHQVAALAAANSVEVAGITGAASINDIATGILAAAPERFALAGLSMGGIVALEMWRQAPQRIQALALLDTNFRADPAERRLLRNDQIDRVMAGQLELILRDELKPNYLARIHRGNIELLDEVLAMGIGLGAAVFIEQSLALRDRPDSTATLSTITCPTLVLCGDEDELCPVELHETMAEHIATAQLKVIRNCGHLSTLEQPAAVTLALQDWLQAA